MLRQGIETTSQLNYFAVLVRKVFPTGESARLEKDANLGAGPTTFLKIIEVKMPRMQIRILSK